LLFGRDLHDLALRELVHHRTHGTWAGMLSNGENNRRKLAESIRRRAIEA
jgi:hypothetical protein